MAMPTHHSPEAFRPDWMSPPGDSIADLLEEHGWNQTSFAERMEYTEKHVSLLINGKAALSEETAFKLEKVTGITAGFWLTREAQYREAVGRVEEEKSLANESEWLKELPVRHMLDHHWIDRYSDAGAQVAECLRFFGVASPNAWRTSYRGPVAAFRASKSFSIDPAATSTWLRQGERQAAGIDTQPFDKAAFKASLTLIRSLASEANPDVFVPKLIESCAVVGVAVVFAAAPKGCPVSGATKWLSPSKALLMLSLRHKTNDHLWFSFFHEAGHLILHGKRMMFIDGDGALDDEQEDEANRFARDVLIPPSHSAALSNLLKTEDDVVRFANAVGIAPGVVVGRMQKEGLLEWNTRLNHLKEKYRFKVAESEE
ncbi:helix-turn-helix domain-containing protein [Rhodoferax sediminis]|nr:helix-turn-helix domain-containing protein [Rhodoferax sediminis]